MQAADIGTRLQIPTGSDLTGLTVSLVVNGPGGYIAVLPLTVLGDNQTLERVTLATDFPTPGDYDLQLHLVGTGYDRTEAVKRITVGPVLARA